MPKKIINDEYKYGFVMPERSVFKVEPGLSRDIVLQISKIKQEPSWMTDFRLKSYEHFVQRPMPTWGADLSKINFDKITYYIKPTEKTAKSWEELPPEIRETYEKIGVPEAERKFLAGVVSQYESESVYENIRKELKKLGVIFCDMDTALKKYPDLVKKYFGKLIPYNDNKFAALNSAVWSGGSFVYVPKNVKVPLPLQAYFRINAKNFGQFERTLIIADKGSFVHYTEGCMPAGSQILKEDGFANIEAIKPGDYVVNHKGELSKVSKVMTRKYKGPLYTIVPVSPYNNFSLTPEHPVLAIKRETVKARSKRKNNWLYEASSKKLIKAKPEFIPAKELKKGDFIVFPKVKINKKNVHLSDEEIEFLGYYLAEGDINYNKKIKQFVVRLTFGEKENNLIKRVGSLMEKISRKRVYMHDEKYKHAVSLSVYSKKLYDLCDYHCGKYAHLKELSKEIMELPTDKIKIFLNAYFKGDGNLCFKKSKNKASELNRISTASEKLALQIQQLFTRIGIFAGIMIRKGGEDFIKGRKIERKNQYVIYFTTNKKWSMIRETKDYFIVPIREIKKGNYEGFVFNIEVEKTNSYLANGFAVHNCTAPIYSTHSLHAAVVEIFALEGARVRYTTVQNWSKNVYNLVTKRAQAEKNAIVEWVDCNLGSCVTMKYPGVVLKGKGAKGEVLSIAYAAGKQHQDTGAKMIHLAPNTSSRIISKSISKDGGRCSYRGLVFVGPKANNVKSYVSCDALILDEKSRSDTYPYMKILNKTAQIEHEATVEKIGEEKLFYLASRGIKKEDAENMLVNGFIEPVAKELPLEYAVELNRLIALEMSGSVG